MSQAFEELRRESHENSMFRGPLSSENSKVLPVECKMGPKTMLSKEVENKIVKCPFTLADAGFPITKQLLDNVTDMISNQGETSENRGPGETWFKLFLLRHPTVHMRVAQNISKASADVSEGGREYTKMVRENAQLFRKQCASTHWPTLNAYITLKKPHSLSPTIGSDGKKRCKQKTKKVQTRALIASDNIRLCCWVEMQLANWRRRWPFSKIKSFRKTFRANGWIGELGSRCDLPVFKFLLKLIFTHS